VDDKVDAVYENVDPIGVTNKLRSDQGSANTVIPGRKDAAFFFTMGLKGSGCPISN
jgi:hypothetical protein